MPDEIQKRRAIAMLEALAVAALNKTRLELTENERETLGRCWRDGIKTTDDIAAITAVYQRFKGVKTPPQQAGEIMAWINEGRRKNGIAECG